MERFLTRSNSIGKRPLEGPIDTSEWKIPKITSRPAEKTSSDPLKTTNRFQELSAEQQCTGSSTVAARLRDASSEIRRSSRVPPILLEIQSTWTHEYIKSTVLKYSKHFHLQYKGNNRLNIICHTADSHQAIKDGLLAENLAYYTYTRRDEKMYKAVIFGLPHYAEENLQADLESLGFPNTTIRRMKTPEGKNNFSVPFLVQLETGSDFEKLLKIKYLSNCAIQIRKFKSKNLYGTQCFRCQGFGHSSRNCNLPYRCVKCTELHPTSECSKTTRELPAQCCNCNGNHPANYRQCKERQKYIQLINERQEKIKASRNPHRPSEVDGRTWNSVAATTNPTQPTTKAVNEPQDQATADMLAILMTIKTLKSQFLACTNMMDKVMLILTHLGHLV